MFTQFPSKIRYEATTMWCLAIYSSLGEGLGQCNHAMIDLFSFPIQTT